MSTEANKPQEVITKSTEEKVVEKTRKSENDTYFWQQETEKEPHFSRKHERSTPPSTESDMTPKRPNLHGDQEPVFLQNTQNESEFYDEEMPDANMHMEPIQIENSWVFLGIPS